MKNQNGISLIALIITIIVIIILAAIVIGGVFNTPNDAKFANFCQEYDRIQTAIQLKYYDLYQKYAIDASLQTLPTHYEIYNEVATGVKPGETGALEGEARDKDAWVAIATTQFAANRLCEKPSLGENGWFLRLNDGKLAYKGFEKAEKEYYYTPNIKNAAGTRTEVAVDSASGNLKAGEAIPEGLELAS